jgi:hypothetical protein
LNRTRNPNSLKNLKPWEQGQSGNPSGRPKRDHGAEIARAIFENNPESIYKAMLQALKAGNPRVFSALADRAYGRIPQHLSVGTGDGEAPNFSLEAATSRPKKIGANTDWNTD